MGAHQFHLERMRGLGATAPSLQGQNDGIKDFWQVSEASEASGQLGRACSGTCTVHKPPASASQKALCESTGGRCRDLKKAGARASDLFKLCHFSPASLLEVAHQSGLKKTHDIGASAALHADPQGTAPC